MPPHEISSKSTSSAERKTSIWEVQEVSKVMKKEAIKKQLFAACDAGDLHMMESLFRAGVPANLIDEKGH